MERLHRLMIVEDEDALRRGLSRAVPWEALGFRVIYEAQNADEALEYLSYQVVDVVLTDIRMPGMSGLELVHTLRGRDPGLKAVIISGYDDFGYAQSAIRAGVVDYLLKPIKKEKLMDVFEKLNRQLKARDARDEHWRDYEAMAEEYVLLRIVSGEYRNGEELEELLNRIGFYPEGEYRAAVFTDMADRVSEMRGALEPRLGRTLLTACGHHAVALIPDHQLESALEAVEPLRAEASARVLVGGTQEEMCNVQFSYQAALRLEHEAEGRAILLSDGERGGAQADPDQRQALWQRSVTKALELGALGRLSRLLREARQMHGDDLLAAKSFMMYSLGELARYFGLLEERSARLDVDPKRLLNAQDMGALFSIYHAQLLSFHGYFAQVRSNPTESSVQKACQIAARSFGDPMFSMSRAADELGISYSYLSTIFKQVMGQGFSQYVTALRMEKARRLLLDGLRVYEVAQRVGAVNARYLAETFKKTYGVTPSEYVARMGGDHARQDDA